MFLKPSKKFLKALSVGLFFGLMFFVVATPFTHAASSTAGSNGTCSIWGDFSLSACISGVFYIGIYFIALIFGVVIAVILWFIEVVLQANAGVVNTAIVQTGYGVALGIANLGFVLGIIIVALATILRQETYGIKGILWKLVVMAILVNFILVIAAPIVGFANGLTMYFLTAMPNGGNGLAGLKGFDNLSSGMAGLFQPQRLIAPENSTGTLSTSVINGAQTVTGVLGTTLGGVIGVVMAVIGLAAMIIFLLVFFVMLVIRYVYLTVLLIISPFAWMLWIFPKTSGNFSKWWDKFIKQAFFPPFAMFFIWLVVKTGDSIKIGQSVAISSTGVGSGFSKFIAGLGNGLIAPQVSTLINTSIIIGLLMGGLVAAEKMSTEGSKLAAQVVGTVKNSVQGYATKRGEKLARGTARRLGAEKLVKAMREGNLGEVARNANLRIPFGKNRGINIPVGKGFGSIADSGAGQLAGAVADKTGLSWLASRAASNIGRQVEPLLSNKDILEDAKKKVTDDVEKMKGDLKGNMSLDDQVAYLVKLAEKGELAKDQKVNGVNAEDFIDKHLKDIKDYGQGKFLGDVAKLWLEDANYRAAKRAGNGPVTVVDDIKDEFGKVIYKAGEVVSDAAQLMDASMEKMVKGLTKADASKINATAGFSTLAYQKDKAGFERKLGAIAIYNRDIIPNIMGKMKSSTIINVNRTYEAAIDARLARETQRADERIAAVQADASIDASEKGGILESLRFAKTKLPEAAIKGKRSIFRKIDKAGLDEGRGDAAPAAAP
jgi:hypothetical protein